MNRQKQWEQMANQVGSYFPKVKGGHSATQTELKVLWKYF